MWFFTPLFGLYLSMPFLKVFVQNASKKLVWLFIAFGFVFDSVLPFLFDVCDVNFLLIDNDYKEPAFFAMASNFVYIGVLGYMLTHVDIPRKYRMCIYSVGALTAIIHFCLLVFGTISTGKVVRIELNYFYPSSVLIPMAVIVFFRYTNWDKLFGTEKSWQIIAKLAGCSLGVYLLQYLLQIIIGYFDVPLNNCLTGFALLYVLGVVITLIMKKIPVINKLV